METYLSIKVNGVKKVAISGEFIKLDSLLKFASIASTGGEAKFLINNGSVFVGHEMCRIRGKKIRPGDIVRCNGIVLVVVSVL